MSNVYVYDPTATDELSRVRGIGRYLQILKENFPDWSFGPLHPTPHSLHPVLINPFFNFLAPPLTMKRIAKKQIAVIHDLIPLKYGTHFPAGIRGNMNIFFNRRALKNYDLIITDSEASKGDIIRILKIPDNKVRVVYPCLSRSFLNPKSEIATTNYKLPTTSYQLPPKYCLYVGDATWNKNLVNIAKAVKIINATCVFIGKVFPPTPYTLHPTPNLHPWQKEFRGFLDEIKGDKRFVFMGFVPDSQLFTIYQQATLNILVSRDEGFGFSYLEAAANSCPSILSDITVLREVSDSKAMFAEPENPQDIANKIGEIYFRRDVRNRLGRQAFKRSQFFTPENFKNSFISAISD